MRQVVISKYDKIEHDCGFDGEHFATELSLIIPDDITLPDGGWYEIAFRNADNRKILSGPITPSNGFLKTALWQDINVEGTLEAQIVTFIVNSEDPTKPLPISMSPVAYLKVGHSVRGLDTLKDNTARGLIAELQAMIARYPTNTTGNDGTIAMTEDLENEEATQFVPFRVEKINGFAKDVMFEKLVLKQTPAFPVVSEDETFLNFWLLNFVRAFGKGVSPTGWSIINTNNASQLDMPFIGNVVLIVPDGFGENGINTMYVYIETPQKIMQDMPEISEWTQMVIDGPDEIFIYPRLISDIEFWSPPAIL